MENIIRTYERCLRKIGLYVLTIPLLVMAIIETLNTIGRKIYVPFPCAVEAVESLLVISVYFGVSAVAMEGGHINVVMLTEKLSKPIQRWLDAICNFIGAIIFGFLGYAAWLGAIKALSIMEVRIGVYRFHVWPFRIFFAIGLTMLSIQLIINVIKHINTAIGKINYAGIETTKKDEFSEL